MLFISYGNQWTELASGSVGPWKRSPAVLHCTYMILLHPPPLHLSNRISPPHTYYLASVGVKKARMSGAPQLFSHQKLLCYHRALWDNLPFFDGSIWTNHLWIVVYLLLPPTQILTSIMPVNTTAILKQFKNTRTQGHPVELIWGNFCGDKKNTSLYNAQ